MDEIKCPWCGATIEERVGGLTWQIRHTPECMFTEVYGIGQVFAIGDDDEGHITILQKYQVANWNRIIK